MVIFFFGFTTLCALVSAYFLPKLASSVAGKRFGLALLFTGIAFAFWSYAVITKPDAGLDGWITFGLFFHLIAILLFANSASSHMSKPQQQLVLVGGVIYAVILMIFRAAYPSDPAFSEAGLFFFNPDPVVKFLEIVLFSITIIPATIAVGREIGDKDSLSGNIFTASILTTLIGGILLLVSTEDTVLYLDGWAMGIAFFLLLLTSVGLFRKQAR